MNTLAHLAAFIAVLWLSYWLFITVNNDFLGYMALVLVLWVSASLYYAAMDDWDAWQGKDKGKDRD